MPIAPIVTFKTFDEGVWKDLVGRLYYCKGDFVKADTYAGLKTQIGKLHGQYRAGGIDIRI